MSKISGQRIRMWTSIISSHVKNKQEKKAIELYHEMRQSDMKPGVYTYAAVLNACANIMDIMQGKSIHKHILGSGLTPDVFLLNSLAYMYVKCGNLKEAWQVFKEMPTRSLFSWKTMIAGCVQQGFCQEALQLFRKMQQQEKPEPDRTMFLLLLKACSSLRALDQGRQIHSQLVKAELHLDLAIGNTLVDMYSRCGSIREASQVLHSLPKRDIVSWNAIIAGCAQSGHTDEAFKFYEQMQLEGLKPDRVTFLVLLKVIGIAGSLSKGKDVHAKLIESCIPLDVSVGSTLVDMYAKCGGLEEAWEVFMKLPQHNVVSWTAMIAASAQEGHGENALALFRKMQQEGIQPDRVTYLAVLKACSSIRALDQGKDIHSQLVNSELIYDLPIGNALIDMYAACGSIREAHKAFLAMPKHDVVSWNTIIGGCVEQGFCEDAISLFKTMEFEGVKPNGITFAGVLKACTYLTALDQGRLIHSQLEALELDSDLFVVNNLIHMYNKCGSIKEAKKVFLKLSERDVVSWNTMIDGYAQSGHGQDALDLFEKMQNEGIQPDKLTLLSVLTACSHSGLIDEGSYFFYNMYGKFGIVPLIEHYVCMVDILGRAGKLHEAHDFITQMPIIPNVDVWMSLLGACRLHGNVDLGKVSYEAVLRLEPANVAACSLMCELYAANGRFEKEMQIKERMKNASVEQHFINKSIRK